MNLDRTLGLMGLALGIIPYGGLLLRSLTARQPARRFLALNRDHPIDVIVSTNATRPPGAGEARSHTTAIGELRAVAVGARTVLALYKRKKVSVYMSAEYPGRLQDDVLLLGGPLRNEYSKSFLELVNKKYPSAQLVLEAQKHLIGAGGRRFTWDQRSQKGIPHEDLTLLVAASNVWCAEPRQRVVLCAGLSTYGTEGAARFLFQRVLGSPHRLIGSRDAARLRRLLQGPAAAAIVHVIIEQGRMVSCEVYEDACWSASRGGIDKAAMAPATATQ